MGIDHLRHLMPGQETELDALFNNGVAVLTRGRRHNVDVLSHKHRLVLSCGTKVKQVHPILFGVVEKVGIVGIGLHEAPRKELGQGELHELFGQVVAQVLWGSA